MQRAPLLAVLLAVTSLPALAQRRAPVAAAPNAGLQRQELPDEAAEVTFRSSDGLELRAAYFEPRRSKQLVPGALLVHDSGSRGAVLWELAERMQRTGFATLVIDLRGHGRSASEDMDWEELEPDDRKSAWALAIRDLEAASEWLRDQREVHATNVTVVGHRAGSTLAARYALRDENVRAIALIEPPKEQLGIDLAGDLVELGGLPTYIVTPRDSAESTEAMVAEAHAAAGGHPFIELVFSSSRRPAEEKLLDRRTIANIAKWTKDKAFPRK